MPKKKSPGHAAPALTKSPPVPKKLKGEYAVAYWKRITKELVAARTITSLHLEALEALCRQWQDYRTLCDWCDDENNDTIVTYESGHVSEHPKVRLRQLAFTNLQKLWPKFGLTPKGTVEISKGSPAAATVAGHAMSDFAAKKTTNARYKRKPKK